MPTEKTDSKVPSTSQIQNPSSENEISSWGKWWAGIIMIFLTVFCCFFIIAIWPDKLPSPKDTIKPLYINEWFHVRLVDSAVQASITASHPGNNGGPVLIHLNTIILLLVATAGFLGNMIYIASSFTTFVGAGKFKKSWLMWYCVKPFTAAALALGIYFVFRGGFLNMSDDSTNINLYGVITLSLLTGLFTDRATLKLKEVFDVLLKPSEDRPNKLEKTGQGSNANANAGANDQTGAAAPAGTKTAAAGGTGTTGENTTDTTGKTTDTAGDKTDDSNEIKDTNDVVSGGPDQSDDNEPFVKE